MAGASAINKIHVNFKTDNLIQLFLVLCSAEVLLVGFSVVA